MNNQADEQYLGLVKEILDTGTQKKDRTGIGTISIFGAQRKYDLRKGFPLLTTKKVSFDGILRELLWFLKGDTNIKYLVDNNVHIWDEWPFQDYLIAQNLVEKFPMYSDEWKAEKKSFIERIKTDTDFAKQWGELGPVYGKQWRRWEGNNGNVFDQIQMAMDQIKKNPDSRRILVSAWNVSDVVSHKKTAPPLCHTLFQFYVANGRLDLQLYQRSADVALGVPYNVASYSILLMMMAQECGLEPGIFVHTTGDTHLYLNHLDGIKEQLTRADFAAPTLKIAKKPFWDLQFEDFVLENYQYQPPIKFQVAV
jgi:thymidylate synthase